MSQILAPQFLLARLSVCVFRIRLTYYMQKFSQALTSLPKIRSKPNTESELSVAESAKSKPTKAQMITALR